MLNAYIENQEKLKISKKSKKKRKNKEIVKNVNKSLFSKKEEKIEI